MRRELCEIRWCEKRLSTEARSQYLSVRVRGNRKGEERLAKMVSRLRAGGRGRVEGV